MRRRQKRQCQLKIFRAHGGSEARSLLFVVMTSSEPWFAMNVSCSGLMKVNPSPSQVKPSLPGCESLLVDKHNVLQPRSLSTIPIYIYICIHITPKYRDPGCNKYYTARNKDSLSLKSFSGFRSLAKKLKGGVYLAYWFLVRNRGIYFI